MFAAPTLQLIRCADPLGSIEKECKMDIVETLRAQPENPELHEQAAHEIERLRAENEILRTAMACADVAMAGAPIMHARHLELAAIIAGLQRALAAADIAETAYIETHPRLAA